MIPTLTKKDLATIAGYSYRQIYNIDRDLPQERKLFVESEDGKYDLAFFVQRWVRYNIDRETADVEDLDVVKAIHEKVKTEKTELEVARLRGQLVDVNDVRRLWADIANTVTQNMIRLPSKLAPLLLMEDSTERIAAVIDQEIRDVLNGIAETPLPEYAAEAGDNESEDSEDTL